MPLITPYKENEEIDYEKYAELIEYLIKKDLCDSFIVAGTTGEAALFSYDEKVQLMKTALKVSAGRKPVIAGTGCPSTKETIALTKEAEFLGIDLAMVVCPYYNKPTQEGIYLHYKKLAETVNLNILLYNIPIFVGVNIEADTVKRLASTDYFLATEEVDPEFVVINGDDIMLLPTIVQGAMGIVSGGAHIFGRDIREIFSAFEAGNNDRAKELFVPLYKFCVSTGQNGRILPNSILRPAIELVTGIKLGPARGPMAPVTKEEMAVTTEILKRAGKL